MLEYDKTEIMVMLQAILDNSHPSDNEDDMTTIVNDVRYDSFKWVMETTINYINSNCKRRKKHKEEGYYG